MVRPSLATTGLCLASAALAQAANLRGGIKPNKEAARQRAPEIFNAVHDAMRQWGSSVHHNGMSFFLATVPEGVLFHHGSHQQDTPTAPDWLAYEIEHAELFARARGPPPGPPPGHRDARTSFLLTVFDDYDSTQQVISESPVTSAAGAEGGWLHVYRTTKPLRLLYIDGMSAGKTRMGTLDTQDMLLRGLDPETIDDKVFAKPPKRPMGDIAKKPPRGPMDEEQRAKDLCSLCQDWGLQGVIRMEVGFEIIKCDFSDSLEQVQVLQRPSPHRGSRPRHGLGDLEFIRGIAERYEGIGASRTAIDFSSMVSSFFFSVNLTNPDAERQDLPRLSNTTATDLAAVKTYLTDMIGGRRDEARREVDWQGVSDMIVSRYADRLRFMVEKVVSTKMMLREVKFLLEMFIDHSKEGDSDLSDAVNRCAMFYLQTISRTTEADHMLHTAFTGVTTEICTTLFRVRELVVGEDDDDEGDAGEEEELLETAIQEVQGLLEYLRWARFKRCPACGLDEVCFIPMWPLGTVDEYHNPRCVNSSEPHRGESYWGSFPPRPEADRQANDEL